MTITKDIIELAKKIDNAQEWDMDDCRALCEALDMGDEWEAADGETFEAVVEKAVAIALKEDGKKEITIYMRKDENTRPRGFGNPPTYHILVEAPQNKALVWWTPIKITLPDGYHVAQCNDWQYCIFDAKGESQDIIDHNGYPCINTAESIWDRPTWRRLDKPRYPHPRYIRRDK